MTDRIVLDEHALRGAPRRARLGARDAAAVRGGRRAVLRPRARRAGPTTWPRPSTTACLREVARIVDGPLVQPARGARRGDRARRCSPGSRRWTRSSSASASRPSASAARSITRASRSSAALGPPLSGPRCRVRRCHARRVRRPAPGMPPAEAGNETGVAWRRRRFRSGDRSRQGPPRGLLEVGGPRPEGDLERDGLAVAQELDRDGLVGANWLRVASSGCSLVDGLVADLGDDVAVLDPGLRRRACRP